MTKYPHYRGKLLLYAESMSSTNNPIGQRTPLGRVNFRNDDRLFSIFDTDRLNHISILGRSGSGKSTLLANAIVSDLQKGKSCALIDPHGDLCDIVLDYVPYNRLGEVIYINGADAEYPIAFNPLKNVPLEHQPLVASGLVSTFKKIWHASWGVRLEYLLLHAISTALEHGNLTLQDLKPLLTDPVFRAEVLTYVKSPHLLAFWKNEYDRLTPMLRAEYITPVLNKVGLFSSIPALRNIFGQRARSFDMLDAMDSGKVILVNAAKGKIGEQGSAILGSVIVTAIQLAALQRADQKPEDRKPFYLYVDECQSFISLAFSDILAESRKYKLSACLCCQSLSQLDPAIVDAIYSNAGTIISFAISAKDGERMAQEFYPEFTMHDFVSLPKYSYYIRLMIQGQTSRPFSARSLPLPVIKESLREEVIRVSREKYGRSLQVILKEELPKPTLGNTATLF